MFAQIQGLDFLFNVFLFSAGAVSKGSWDLATTVTVRITLLMTIANPMKY